MNDYQIKRAVLEKLNPKTRKEIFERLKKNFIEEDEAEPFVNREYVESTIALFDLLIDGNEDKDYLLNGGAICDVISDIMFYFKGEYVE